jgi:hypothetical protein
MQENLLPVELLSLTANMSNEKQNEIKELLNQVFTGCDVIKQSIEAINVKDINDIVSINDAEAARKKIKSMRLNAEKLFDSKREFVQKLKSEYDTEDKLLLKCKQITVIMFKEIEEIAEWKANTIKRHREEQHEIKAHKRTMEVVKYANINRIEYENLSDENFQIFINGLETEYLQKKEAERLEQEKERERILKEKQERERISLENERIKKENELLKQQIPVIEKQPKVKDIEITVETWVNSFNLDFPGELKDNKVALDIYAKFNSFKYWAQKQIINEQK